MRIRQKYYPYPVMERGTDAYKEFSFLVQTTAKKEGYYVQFEFTTSIGDSSIAELIENGKAVFAYHIQCAQTCFRAVYETNEYSFSKKIKEDDLNGIVEVCPFIIAKTNLQNFSSTNFSSDYTGFSFEIDNGGILAIGDQSQHIINKDLTDLNNTSSIFLVTAHPSASEENMHVDIREQKILVVLPQEQFGIYKSVSKNPVVQKAMHAMIFVPALMWVLVDLKSKLKTSNSFADYEDYRWILGLEKAAKKNFDKPLEELLSKYEPLELAQMLLKNPMNAAFEMYKVD